jgi:hypothetical protein
LSITQGDASLVVGRDLILDPANGLSAQLHWLGKFTFRYALVDCGAAYPGGLFDLGQS